jgi:hypothetical protein
VEEKPEAIILLPEANENFPILSLSQLTESVLLSPPTLKAPFSAYHIILTPAPLIGGFLGLIPKSGGPVNTTLLSATCSRANGVFVPMPTKPNSESTVTRTRLLVRIAKERLSVVPIKFVEAEVPEFLLIDHPSLFVANFN